jgi:CTP:molybdopterin cytidylyltransferase MocA
MMIPEDRPQVEGVAWLLLAAGDSIRMGVPKGLLDADGKPWIEVALDHLRNCCDQVFVVLGKQADLYRAAVPMLNHCEIDTANRLHVIANTHTDRGPFWSVFLGLQEFLRTSRADVVAISPIDSCLDDLNLLNALKVEFLRRPQLGAMRVRHDDRGGHPLFLRRHFVEVMVADFVDRDPALCRLDQALLKISQEYSDLRLEDYRCEDRKVLTNFNTVEEWVRYRAETSARQQSGLS